MKTIYFTLIIGILFYACGTKIKYFDENNTEISKSNFYQMRSTNILLDIPGDSAHHKKLILREKRGKITNRAFLESLISKEINQEIDANKPMVIIYHPGKDLCNSSGSDTKSSNKFWFGELEDGVYKIAKTKPIYLYKHNSGLKKYDGILTWHKDPNGIIERQFFNHHYPCSSFVVIAKDGNYISYFGEYSFRFVWEATELMNK